MQKRTRLIVGLAVLAFIAAALVYAVTTFEWNERICRNGEYPARGANGDTSRICVRNDQEPPPGFERYPAGQVPKVVGDKYDT